MLELVTGLFSITLRLLNWLVRKIGEIDWENRFVIALVSFVCGILFAFNFMLRPEPAKAQVVTPEVRPVKILPRILPNIRAGKCCNNSDCACENCKGGDCECVTTKKAHIVTPDGKQEHRELTPEEEEQLRPFTEDEFEELKNEIRKHEDAAQVVVTPVGESPIWMPYREARGLMDGKPVVVMVTAGWCQACPGAAKEVEQLAREGVVLTKLDFDRDQEAKELAPALLPAFYVYGPKVQKAAPIYGAGKVDAIRVRAKAAW